MADIFRIPPPPVTETDVRNILEVHNLDPITTGFYFGGIAVAESLQKAKQLQATETPYNKIDFAETSVSQKMQNRRAQLGGLVFSNLEIPAQTYTDIDGQVIEIPEIRWDLVLFACYRSKIIVKEMIKGSDGPVMEHTAFGPWEVAVRGVFAAKNGDYPFEDMEKWAKLVNVKYSFKVNSWYLNMLGINTIAIESENCEQEEGRGSIQRFTLGCVADKLGELLFL